MTDETLNNVSSETELGKDAVDFVEAIKSKDSIISSKDQEIAKLRAEKGYLINQMTNNIQPDQQVVDDGPSKADLEKILLNPESTNLQIVTASLKHREIVLQETGKDEYAASVATGQRYDVHPNQLLEAEQSVQALQELVDQANGDDDVFNTLIKKAGGPSNKFIR